MLSQFTRETKHQIGMALLEVWGEIEGRGAKAMSWCNGLKDMGAFCCSTYMYKSSRG